MILGNAYPDFVFSRTLDLGVLLKQKSVFLFGPRGTGKSHLIEHAVRPEYPDAKLYDLLSGKDYRRLVQRPELLNEENPGTGLVIVDEIQKLPALLDEVHRLIEKRGLRFLLTGSSARKLRRGAANMLAGRAWSASLLPLTSAEIPDFDLLTYLNRGGMPAVYTSPNPAEDLHSYVDVYLRDEIQSEALTRRIGHFARFLDCIALTNGQELAYESLASDTGIQAKTIRNYVEILKDTLLGFEVEAFRRTRTRKAISRSKFFLFDIGVTNTLCERSSIRPKSELFGVAFEHFIALELRAYMAYRRIQKPLRYWRSTSQFEVDFIIGQELAIEVKSSDLVSERDLKGLKALREEGLIAAYAVVSLDPERRTLDGIEIWPWGTFLQALWRDEFVFTDVSVFQPAKNLQGL